VLAGALGVLVSVAVPSYLRVVKWQAGGTFTASALALWQDISSRQQSSSNVRGPQGEALDSAPVVSRSIRPEAMNEFLRLYDMTGQEPGASQAVIVVEPAGLPVERCARDGKIHIIPAEAAPDGTVSAVTVLVTGSGSRGGPAGDALLAVYKIRTQP